MIDSNSLSNRDAKTSRRQCWSTARRSRQPIGLKANWYQCNCRWDGCCQLRPREIVEGEIPLGGFGGAAEHGAEGLAGGGGEFEGEAAFPPVRAG